MRSVTVRNTLRESISVVLAELRDWWAIAVAEIAAGLAYAFGRSELEAIAVGAAVLAVRVAAGILLPVPTDPGRLRRPPMRDRQIQSYLEKEMSVQEIARRMKVSERYVTRVQREMEREKQREQPRPLPGASGTAQGHWYDDPYIRGTLTAAGFLSLAYTIYRIVTDVFGRRL